MGRVLGGIRLAGVLLSASVLLHSFLSASKIISDGRNKDIPIDQLCDTVHVVVGSLQFQLTTKNEIGNPFWGSLSHFFVGAILQQPLVARSSYPTQKLPRLPVTETGAVCYTLFVLFIHVFSSSRAIICGDF